MHLPGLTSFLQSSLWFLDNSSSPTKIIEVVCSCFASIFVILAFTPQIFSIWKSKDTCGVNKMMYLLHFIVAFSFFLSSTILQFALDDTLGKVTGCVLTFLNLYVGTGALYVYLLKTQNMEDAQKLGLNETEYYKNHIVPSLEQAKRRK